MSKIIRRTLLGLVGLVVLAAAFLWVVGPRNVVGMLRYDQRREGDLRVGVPAPDVSLVALDGRTPVRIADSIGKQPLVIVGDRSKIEAEVKSLNLGPIRVLAVDEIFGVAKK